MQADFARNDFLGLAAMSKGKAKAAAKAGNFQSAWKHHHDQKASYMQHAARCGFTRAQVIALDASVSVDLANILRLEGRHTDALVHTIYWVATLGVPLPRRGHDKLRAYLNRCKLKNTTLSELVLIVEDLGVTPDLVEIQLKVTHIMAHD